MAPRSSIELLPVEIREWLETRLRKAGFGSYREICDELNAMLGERGLQVTVGKSALHSWGQGFEKRIARLQHATQIARIAAKEIGDDEGALNDYLGRLLQEKLLSILTELEDVEAGKVDILKLGHLIADMTRASVTQKKHQLAVRERVQEAAEKVESITRKGGLSDDAVARIKAEILGISAKAA